MKFEIGQVIEIKTIEGTTEESPFYDDYQIVGITGDFNSGTVLLLKSVVSPEIVKQIAVNDPNIQRIVK